MYISWRDSPQPMPQLQLVACSYNIDGVVAGMVAGGTGVHIVARQSAANASVTACSSQATDDHITADCLRDTDCVVSPAVCVV